MHRELPRSWLANGAAPAISSVLLAVGTHTGMGVSVSAVDITSTHRPLSISQAETSEPPTAAKSHELPFCAAEGV
jgi:hypothetical protein